MGVRHLLIIAANILLTSQVVAQSIDPDQKALFAAYVNSQVYRAYLERIFDLGEPPTLKAKCKSMKVVEQNGTILVEQPKFVRGANGNFGLDTGSWVARVVLDRCGSRVIRRALLKAIPGANQMKPTFLLPGDFHGNLKLEADAIRIVTPGLMAFAGCSDRSKFQVTNVASSSPASASGWSETWTAAACDKEIEAEVTYTATETGMNISAGNWKVH